jgi:hypothetical protein
MKVESLREISDFVKEEDKLKAPYLIGNIDRHIADLAYNKLRARKAYDFFNGVRDNYEFAHLIDNYGLQTPTDLPFVPVMAAMIKALTNIQLQNPLDYLITCQNEEALVIKLEKRKKLILDEIYQDLQKKLSDNTQKIKEFQSLPKEEQEKKQEEFERELKKEDAWINAIILKINNKYGSEWLADFEVAANSYMQYYIDRYNLKQIFNTCLQDLLVTGEQYIRTYIDELSRDPKTKTCNAEELYHDMNEDIFWLEDARRVVYREWLSPGDILNRFGHLLEEEDRLKLDVLFADYYSNASVHQTEVVTDITPDGTLRSHERLSSVERRRFGLISVCHVEWLSPNPVKMSEESMQRYDLVRSYDDNVTREVFRMDRYEGYKIEIGHGIYFGYGKSEFISRSSQEPLRAKLSYNGCVYRLRNAREPYSLVLATSDIQNMYDITYFQLNQLLSSVIPGGSTVVTEWLPKEFGNTVEERLIKSLAYKKMGAGNIISISQEGLEGNYAFNQISNFGANLDGGLLQAYISYLEVLEQQAMKIVGLNRQILGQIEELDGKGTTTMAVKNGEIINKDFYFLHGLLIKQTLTNIINLSRLSIRSSRIGSITSGASHKIFFIESDMHQLADYNVFISDDLDDKAKLAKSDELLLKAMDANVVDLRVAFDALMSSSISKRKQAIQEGFAALEKPATQQLNELVEQLELMEKELEEKNKEIEKLSGGKDNQTVQLEREKLKLREKIELEKIKSRERIETERNAIRRELKDLEERQLNDDNKKNDIISRIGIV